jgi:3-hydroxybutyryl-CoA dehydratase
MSGTGKGYWEDFEVGKRYPTTSRTITEEDHLAFCKLVGYEVPLFLDEAYAKTTPYGGRICPSHLTMSFSTAMTGRLFADTVLGLLAVERGKFLKPVRPGDTIRTEVEVIEKKPTSQPDRGIVVFRDHVINQNGETVFQMDKITLLKRRPT